MAEWPSGQVQSGKVAKWQSGKVVNLPKWQSDKVGKYKVAKWQSGKFGKVAKWQSGKFGKVVNLAKWQKVTRWPKVAK